MQDKKVIRSNQYGFNKRKLELTNMVAFNSEVTSLMEEGKEEYLYFLL